jgi:hypothetical protein
MITTQSIQNAGLALLRQQGQRGFKPTYMLTYHYANPLQRGWGATGRQNGKGGHSLLSRSSNGITRMRNCSIQISADACHIRNLMLRTYWDVKDFRKHDESTTPMIFFHEKGQGLQYHTHILINALPSPFTSIEAVVDAWNREITPRAQCLSRSNSVHVRVVDSSTRAFHYLVKELNPGSSTIDYEASCLIKTPSKMEVFMESVETEERIKKAISSYRAARTKWRTDLFRRKLKPGWLVQHRTAKTSPLLRNGTNSWPALNLDWAASTKTAFPQGGESKAATAPPQPIQMMQNLHRPLRTTG